MELNKEHWTKEDIPEFQEYLRTFENPARREWATNMLKTNLPVLCLKTVDMKSIISKVAKGNYIEFLDLMIWEYYENTAINGFLICKIKDFNIRKKYLDIYSSKADNWATCDLLEFNVAGNEENYYNLALEYIKSDKPFVRRIGLYILFNYINKEYIDRIFKILDGFSNEEEYYVNMMLGWLLSECFILQREKTLEYLEKSKLNKEGINKGIQKCKESRRISVEDKEMLVKFKKK